MIKITKNYLTKILIGLFLFTPVKADFDIKASTVILQDYFSGEILFEKDADKSIYPASMTKIMTSIVAFDLIEKGDLSLDDKFKIPIFLIEVSFLILSIIDIAVFLK